MTDSPMASRAHRGRPAPTLTRLVHSQACKSVARTWRGRCSREETASGAPPKRKRGRPQKSPHVGTQTAADAGASPPRGKRQRDAAPDLPMLPVMPHAATAHLPRASQNNGPKMPAASDQTCRLVLRKPAPAPVPAASVGSALLCGVEVALPEAVRLAVRDLVEPAAQLAMAAARRAACSGSGLPAEARAVATAVAAAEKGEVQVVSPPLSESTPSLEPKPPQAEIRDGEDLVLDEDDDEDDDDGDEQAEAEEEWQQQRRYEQHQQHQQVQHQQAQHQQVQQQQQQQAHAQAETAAERQEPRV